MFHSRDASRCKFQNLESHTQYTYDLFCACRTYLTQRWHSYMDLRSCLQNNRLLASVNLSIWNVPWRQHPCYWDGRISLVENLKNPASIRSCKMSLQSHKTAEYWQDKTSNAAGWSFSKQWIRTNIELLWFYHTSVIDSCLDFETSVSPIQRVIIGSEGPRLVSPRTNSSLQLLADNIAAFLKWHCNFFCHFKTSSRNQKFEVASQMLTG